MEVRHILSYFFNQNDIVQNQVYVQVLRDLKCKMYIPISRQYKYLLVYNVVHYCAIICNQAFAFTTHLSDLIYILDMTLDNK